MHELHIRGAAERAGAPDSERGAAAGDSGAPERTHGDNSAAPSDEQQDCMPAPRADNDAPPLPSYLRPPPRIDGAEWGLGIEAATDVDASLTDRVADLTALKRERGIHFNESIARSRAFHNPRIYEKLVKWAGLEETGTNHSAAGTAWDPQDPLVLAYGNAPRLGAYMLISRPAAALYGRARQAGPAAH